MTTDKPTLLAYRCTWRGVTGIVAAATASKARHITRCGAADVGWAAEYRDIRVRRAPEYDGWAATGKGGKRCVSEEYLKQEEKP